jgi:hypothetical protein
MPIITRQGCHASRRSMSMAPCGCLPGGQQGRAVTVGSRDPRMASPTAPPTVGRNNRPPKAVHLGRPAGAASLARPLL